MLYGKKMTKGGKAGKREMRKNEKKRENEDLQKKPVT